MEVFDSRFNILFKFYVQKFNIKFIKINFQKIKNLL